MQGHQGVQGAGAQDVQGKIEELDFVSKEKRRCKQAGFIYIVGEYGEETDS